MRKWIFTMLVALLVLSLVVGCGATPEPTAKPAEPTAKPAEPTATTAAPTEPAAVALKVGMVSDVGGIDDASFNQNTWEGLQKAAKDFGLQAQFIESQAQADYEKNITEFAEQKYDLIITVGFLLGDATGKMAAQYPDTKMAIVDYAYDPPIPNVQGIIFNVDEAAFPIGFLAAAWADMKDPSDAKVGYVGGMQIPPVEQFIVAYEAGVKYYNEKYGKNVEAKGVYVGDFESPDKGKIAGQSLLDEGVDVIFGVGGKTGNGGITAAKEAGKWGIGVDVDQYLSNPDSKACILTSAEKKLKNAVSQLIVAVSEGTDVGGNAFFSAVNDGIGLAPYYENEALITPEIQAAVDAAYQGFIDGTVDPCAPQACVP